MKRFLAVTLILVMVFSFALTTASAITFTPPGLQKKGGLPPGIQKRFLNHERNQDGKDSNVYETVIQDIHLEERRIVIKEGTAFLHLLVSDKATITLDGVTSKLEDLRKNDKVILTVDDQNTIVKIEATKIDDRVITEVVEGKIVAIDRNAQKITIQHENVAKTYAVLQNAVIKINGQKKTFDDLVINMEVKATIENNGILLIEVTSSEYTYVEGIIKSIGGGEVIIKSDDLEALYKATDSTRIYIDGKTARLSDLSPGMEVELYVIGIKIITLNAKSLPVQKITAVVKSVDTENREIVLLYEDKEELFQVHSNAVIKINGANRPLSAIQKEMEVEVKIQEGKIIEIIVNTQVTRYQGRLVAKSTGDQPTVTLEIDGKYQVFKVKKELDLSEVRIGKQVIVYVTNNEVFAIQER